MGALILSFAVGAAAFGNILAAEAGENTEEAIYLSEYESTVSDSAAEAEIYYDTAVYEVTYSSDSNIKSSYTVNGVNLPLEGYEPGKEWYNCWTFANIVYEAIWGTSRGTNMLKDLSGSDLSITSANTKKYIQEAELGANIRLEDGKGIYQHSLILVQKDSNGFTVYHGNYNSKIYFTYYTYEEFASHYASYKYFAYIVFPVDEETTEASTESVTEAAEDITAEAAGTNDTRVSIGSKTVSIGGEEYQMDVAPYIQEESSSTLVPLRLVAIAILGGNIEDSDTNDRISWDAETKTAYITTADGDVITFTADSKYMTVNGTAEEMSNGVKAEIAEGRLFIPFRALGEALGIGVNWDSTTKTAIYTAE